MALTLKKYNYNKPKSASYQSYMPDYYKNTISQPKGNYQSYMPKYQKYEYTKPSETYSDKTSPYNSDIAAAQNKLAALEKNKPQGYTSAYTDRINEIINNMANRKFTYDVNGDALYQQYKNNYMAQGKKAMQDTIGQASAMTGGYGNSYAAAVGNQAYQSYLDQLNDRIPELYQLALSAYNTEGTDLQNLYSMLANQESQEYGKYRDTVADYQTDRGYYDTQLQNLRTMGQNLWGKNWENYWSAANLTSSNEQAARADAIKMMSQAWDNYWSGKNLEVSDKQNAIKTALELLGVDWDNYHWNEQMNNDNYWKNDSSVLSQSQLNEEKRQYDLGREDKAADRALDYAQLNESKRQFDLGQSQSAAQSAAQIAYQKEKDQLDRNNALEIAKAKAVGSTSGSSTTKKADESKGKNVITKYAKNVVRNLENSGVPASYAKQRIYDEYKAGNITKYEYDEMKKHFKNKL